MHCCEQVLARLTQVRQHRSILTMVSFVSDKAAIALQVSTSCHMCLQDAVSWAVQHGIADPKCVAIYGGSYGGYATLAGLAFTPELYACGVDVVGPSHVRTLLQSVPPYWEVRLHGQYG